jgi:predicted hydrocarbon binding protein
MQRDVYKSRHKSYDNNSMANHDYTLVKATSLYENLMKSSSLRIKLMGASLIMLLAMALVLSINVNRALNNAGNSINDNTDQVTAAEEQSQVAEEINKNLTIIGDAADTLAQLSEQSQQSNQHLISQVDSLDQQLGKLHT